MNEEEKISREARDWITHHKKEIIERFVPKEVVPDRVPTTVFMAGSPGAGKTEVSSNLLKDLGGAIRIDADEIRSLCVGYTGENAHVFQEAATKGVHILFDHAIEKKLNMILDGTFAYGDAIKNIDRSLSHGRTTQIIFVYQDPLQAWEFTKRREVLEHRRVTKEVFVNAFFASQENVRKVKQLYGKKVGLTLVIKNIKDDLRQMELNIESIDPFLKQKYTRDELISLLS